MKSLLLLALITLTSCANIKTTTKEVIDWFGNEKYIIITNKNNEELIFRTNSYNTDKTFQDEE